MVRKIMTVKCTKICESNQIKEHITIGKEYLVIEIINKNTTTNKHSDKYYRIIDNDGIPCLYEANCFESESNSTEGMVIIETGWGQIFTHRWIADNRYQKENPNGFWAEFFESKNIEVHNLVRKVVKDLNSRAELDIPDIKAF